MMAMVPLFVALASPVMVQETHKSTNVKSRKLKTYSMCNTESNQRINSSDVAVFCELRQRKRLKTTRINADVLKCNHDSTMHFPFLCDWQTRKLIQRSKVLFVMRGLAGSGKSTIAKAIAITYPASVICSADEYFLRDGKYKFDAACLGAAHMTCQYKAKVACQAGVPVVVIDNTNVRRWEMKYYLKLAHEMDYIVMPVQPKTAWRFDPEELAKKNQHGVDPDCLKRKVDQFDDIIPVYYAWFLNGSSSKQLSFIYEYLLEKCIQLIPAFAESLQRSKQLHVSHEQPSQLYNSSGDSGILKQYYTTEQKIGSLYHCTAKFCGNGKALGAKHYHARPKVQNSLGKAFILEITSICFSPRTSGARIQLSEDQLDLFDKPEEREWNYVQRYSAVAIGTDGTRSLPETIDSSSQMKSGLPDWKKGESRFESEKDIEIPFENDSRSLWKRDLDEVLTKPVVNLGGRSAHITLGCAPEIQAHETNFDVLQLCDLEASFPADKSHFKNVTGGKARYFGDGICCVYLEPHLLVSTIYSGFY